MRKLTRMAVIGGVGLLALTACGDDEPEQEQTPESAEEREGGADPDFTQQEVEDRVATDPDEPTDVTCPSGLPRDPGSYVICEVDDDSADSDSSNVIVTVEAGEEMQIRITGDQHDPDSPHLEEMDGDPADPSNW